MKELLVISGKGGTGKTSITASFAALASSKCVIADCDVDAADLFLVLSPSPLSTKNFSGGKRAKINSGLCIGCGKCLILCRFDAISRDKKTKNFEVDPIACEGCGVCAWFCPAKAIDFDPAVNGESRLSRTMHGILSHAKLGIAEENSGKLVSVVREEARKQAEANKKDLILIDGPPGIGCPVIASLSGVDFVLLVTEPTLSGLHDLERAAALIRHFKIPGMVCVNKWDLNPEITATIEEKAAGLGLEIGGRIRYDRAVTEAQICGKSVVEYQRDGCSEDIRALWKNISESLFKKDEKTGNEF